MMSSVRPASSETSSSVTPEGGSPAGSVLPRRRGMANLAAHGFSSAVTPDEMEAAESTASSDTRRFPRGVSRPGPRWQLMPPAVSRPLRASATATATGVRRTRQHPQRVEAAPVQIQVPEHILQAGWTFLESVTTGRGAVLRVLDEAPSVRQGDETPCGSDTESTGVPVSMLQREIYVDSHYNGGEMVEAEIRRAVAESSYVRLRRHVAVTPSPAAVLASLHAWVATAPDALARAAALRVLQVRIDPRDAQGRFSEQFVYQPLDASCGSIGLRDLAALVWSAVQQAPVDDAQREALRMLLLYNLADCVKGVTFYCFNGTFQRLMAPLDGVYPGVQTLTRTPYELVQQVALQWREAIARGERADTASDWQAFEDACTAAAHTYFEPDMPLYAAVLRQVHGAVAVCRTTLQEEID